MALPNLWGLYNLRSSPYVQATLRSDTEATPLNLFVGRERERQLLLTTIGSGRSSRQAVAGRPGIGKTTLVQAVKADAQEAGYWTSSEIMSLGSESNRHHRVHWFSMARACSAGICAECSRPSRTA